MAKKNDPGGPAIVRINALIPEQVKGIFSGCMVQIESLKAILLANGLYGCHYAEKCMSLQVISSTDGN